MTLPTSTQLVKLSDDEYAINTIIPFLTHQQRFIPGSKAFSDPTIPWLIHWFALQVKKLSKRQSMAEKLETFSRSTATSWSRSRLKRGEKSRRSESFLSETWTDKSRWKTSRQSIGVAWLSERSRQMFIFLLECNQLIPLTYTCELRFKLADSKAKVCYYFYQLRRLFFRVQNVIHLRLICCRGSISSVHGS